MSHDDLERLSKGESIELVLELQRPVETSRTSSKTPSTDRRERCEQSRPGGAKPAPEGHGLVIAEDLDTVVDHRPGACPNCGLAPSADLPAEKVSVNVGIELPEVKSVVEQHRHLVVARPGCPARVAVPRPASAASTPFNPRLRATVSYLKLFQILSYGRWQRTLFDLFGLHISQGGLTSMLRQAETRFDAGREAALSALRHATVVACCETGAHTEGTKSYRWILGCEEPVMNHAAPTRSACVAHEIMDGHRPAMWLSDRHSAHQGHADRQQTCLAHFANDDTLAPRLKPWLDGALALVRPITTAAASAVTTKRRELESPLDEILSAPTIRNLARDIQNRMRCAHDQLLTFASFPGRSEAHNDACEHDLGPAVMQSKNTNGPHAMWSAKGEAAVHTVITLARITSDADTFSTLLRACLKKVLSVEREAPRPSKSGAALATSHTLTRQPLSTNGA